MEPGLPELDSLAGRHGLSVAIAESLTCGKLALTIGGAEGSGQWLRGGVVAYHDDVKFSVLGVTPGPVITAECASEMALGVADLLGARLGIGVTGVGGPGTAEGVPPGHVFVAATLDGITLVEEHRFSGEPEDVMSSTVDAAIRLAVVTVSGRYK